MAVIALMGLVAASFLIWWELRTPLRRAPARRAESTRRLFNRARRPHRVQA